MAKGDIYYHHNFPFNDGSKGPKLFIVLNDRQKEEPYLVLKTTSNFRGKSFDPGCNSLPKVFHIAPDGSASFTVNTLIQLEEIFEFSKEEFLNGSLHLREIEYKDKLSELLTSSLLKCLKFLREDISDKHFKLVFP